MTTKTKKKKKAPRKINYHGRERVEVWLLPADLENLERQAEQNHRKLKPHLEFILEQAAKTE